MKGIFKIMRMLFLVLVVLLIATILLLSWYIKSNSKDYSDNNNRILNSQKMNSKKAIIIYQPSKSKLTNKIAEKIAMGINDAGYEVTINHPGKHMSTDISKYSLIVFGSPVYIGQTSSLLSDYMKHIKDFSNKKILLFATGGQLNNGELDKMELQLGDTKATEKVGFKNGLKDGTKAYEVGKKLAGK